METQLRTSSRKPPSAPESRVKGSAPTTGADSTLERLRAEAEKSGDYTKVRAYKQQAKAKRGS